jgi:hypothetical protein
MLKKDILLICSFFLFSAYVALAGTHSVFNWKIDAAPSSPSRPSSPLRPAAPAKRTVPLTPPAPHNPRPTEIRYSQSAQAANMIMPAIWLGLPTVFIIALIIRSMKGD